MLNSYYCTFNKLISTKYLQAEQNIIIIFLALEQLKQPWLKVHLLAWLVAFNRIAWSSSAGEHVFETLSLTESLDSYLV